MAQSARSPSTDRIYLTGFMGSGKSTVGRILADRLERDFADLDEVIVREAGMTIPEIFRLRGEHFFRELEAQTAGRFTRGRWVVALGGGTLGNEATRDVLLGSGTLVYLRARPETLAARLRTQRADRPLLAGEEPLWRRITSLLDSRKEIYSLAHWILDTDGLDADGVADQLQQWIRRTENG